MSKFQNFMDFINLNEGVDDIRSMLDDFTKKASSQTEKKMFAFAAMVAGTHQNLLMGGSSEMCGAAAERIRKVLDRHGIKGIEIEVVPTNHNLKHMDEAMTHWVSFTADRLFSSVGMESIEDDEWLKENQAIIVGGIVLYCLFSDSTGKKKK